MTSSLPLTRARETCYRLRLVGQGDPYRTSVEHYVRRVFMERFDAWPPRLFPWIADFGYCGGQRLGAAGLRRGGEEDFFSEVYLDRPAECLIAERFRVEVPRDSILELGHFAAEQTGAGRAVISVIAALTSRLPCSWMLATLNRPMRRNFRRVGIPMVELAPAEAGRLGSHRVAWGRYYESDPRVVVAHLPAGREALAAAGLLLPVDLEGKTESLQ